MCGVEPRIEILCAGQVAQEQQPRHEEDQGDGHLSDDQHIAHRPATTGNVCLLPLERRRLGALRRLQRRRESAEERRDEDECERVGHEPDVEPRVNLERQRQRKRHAREEADEQNHQEQSRDRAKQRDPEAFGQKLLYEPASAGAQRDAHRHFPAACRRPREQQPGDVGAGNGEDEADDDEQDSKEGADRGEIAELFGRADWSEQPDLTELSLSRPGRLEAVAGSGHRRPARCNALPFPETTDQLQACNVAGRIEVRHHRPTDRQIDLGCQPEPGHRPCTVRQDPDNGEWLAAEHERPAKNVGIGAQAALPESVADHGDRGIAFGLRFRRREAPPLTHRRTDDVEEVGGNDHRVQADTLLRSLPVDADLDVEAGQTAQRSALLELAPLQMRDVAAAAHLDVHELIRAPCGRHREHQLVGQAEDGRIGADRHGNGDHGCNQQHRLPHERAQRVTQILRDVFEECDAARIATLLFDESHRTEHADRRRACVGRAHARSDVLVNLLLQVQLNLTLQRRLHAVPVKERREAKAQAVNQSRHGCAPYSASRTTRPMAVESRSQLSSSRASCFRPAAVSA